MGVEEGWSSPALHAQLVRDSSRTRPAMSSQLPRRRRWGGITAHLRIPIRPRTAINDPLSNCVVVPDEPSWKADISDFDFYACHEKGKPPTLKFDAQHNLIVPKEHEDIVMGHGTHNRNNNCFNCHDEQNLELLQARDGRQIKLVESPLLCGSCHGPTYRDWEA